MRTIQIITAILISFIAAQARAVEVFAQPPSAGGGVHKSSWYAPDGLDGDEYAFDSFTLAATTAISEIHWRGGYTNYLSGAGKSPVYAFTISIYRSIPGGSQPDLGAGGRLATYTVSNNAGETAVGTFGGVIMYDYAYTLASPFMAVGGTKYWVQIEASQGMTPLYYWPPDWGLCTGTGGDGGYFRRITGGPTQPITNDLAFSLFSSNAPTVTINAAESPTGTGVLTGAGAYPVNSTVHLTASPIPGWGFVNWTENGVQVSPNASYNFTATANRNLVANFVPAYTITTSAYPSYAGTTTGGGVYNEGAMVTVTATPNHGFVFSDWMGMSTSASYSFPATSDMMLTAFFVSAPNSVTFDLDNAPVHTSLPIDLTVNGLGAHFTATDYGFSIQPYGSVGLAPAGMSGLYLYPNSVFASDLHIAFTDTLIDFSIMYSPQELGCDTSATMRVTAYLNGVSVGTATATAPNPGTWPTGTLSIAVPSGFDSVVVHYDAKPATCQDWGPIFIADNITVTTLCRAATIAQGPSSTGVCFGDTAYFSVTSGGSAPATYQWNFDSVPIDINQNPSAATQLLAVPALDPAAAGLYDCTVVNGCGSDTSVSAYLTVGLSADINMDNIVNTFDLGTLLSHFGQAGLPSEGDVNGDGQVNTFDLGTLLAEYGHTCP